MNSIVRYSRLSVRRVKPAAVEPWPYLATTIIRVVNGATGRKLPCW
jgi:hypothetical protein